MNYIFKKTDMTLNELDKTGIAIGNAKNDLSKEIVNVTTEILSVKHDTDAIKIDVSTFKKDLSCVKTEMAKIESKVETIDTRNYEELSQFKGELVTMNEKSGHQSRKNCKN